MSDEQYSPEEFYFALLAGDCVDIGDFSYLPYGQRNRSITADCWQEYPCVDILNCDAWHDYDEFDSFDLTLEACTRAFNQVKSGQLTLPNSCGFTSSADIACQDVARARHQLAETDREAWLASFDDHGRYLDRDTGYWQSLNGEIFSAAAGTWGHTFMQQEPKE